MVLNPESVIEDSLEIAFNLRTYIYISEEVRKKNFVASEEFKKAYNGFYRVRQKKQAWYNRYYSLMEQQSVKNASFYNLLWEMFQVNHSVEVSFVSKLMATVNPNLPIWDQYVIRNLGYEKLWQQSATASTEQRIDIAVKIYDAIMQWYENYIHSEEGMACIQTFDLALPKYANQLTAVKKIDYLLWSKR